MADGPRKSSRAVKILRKPGFLYEENGRFLHDIETEFYSNSGSEKEATNTTEKYSSGKACNTTSLNLSDCFNKNLVDKLNTEVPISESPESTKGSQSQSLCQDSDALLSSDLDQLVHNNKEVRIRSKSSTRLDFLSFEDPFLTVSSSVRTDSSDMSNGGGNKVLANDLCKCASGLTPQDCCDKGDEEATSGILLGGPQTLKNMTSQHCTSLKRRAKFETYSIISIVL